MSCCPIFYLFFRFLSLRVQGVWFYCCLCFLSFLCQNFLTFLIPAFSDSTLVAMGYLFATIPKASSALIPGFRCYLGVSIWFFFLDVSQRCHDKLHLKSYHALSLRNCAKFDSLWLEFQISMTANWPINKQITKKSLPCNSLSHNY